MKKFHLFRRKKEARSIDTVMNENYHEYEKWKNEMFYGETEHWDNIDEYEQLKMDASWMALFLTVGK